MIDVYSTGSKRVYIAFEMAFRVMFVAKGSPSLIPRIRCDVVAKGAAIQ